jgi:phospholipase A1
VINRIQFQAACAGLLASFGAQAAPDFSSCVALEADAARLACYDTLAGRVEQPGIAPLPAPDGERDALPSLLTESWELDGNPELFGIRRYKPVYLLPAFHASRANPTPSSPTHGEATTPAVEPDKTEAKFQLSFKTKIANDLFGENGDVWLAYTQSSRWQIYNNGQSRPFRETNYEPEAMFVWRTRFDVLGMTARYAALGINHQSNGQGGALSRSWNRVIGAVALERGQWTLTLRPWWRIAEHGDDDNPDLADYAGRGEILATRVFGGHILSIEARHSLHGGNRSHGSLRTDWAFPIDKYLRGHVQIFSGYGESLIDYNHRATYVGLGVSLAEWH